MQKNPCYGDHTLPVYEEIQLQNKAAELSDVRVKANERISINFAKRVALVVVLSLLAIAMVAAIALSVYALVSSNQGMDNLMQEIQELKLQLKKTKEASEADIAQLINVTDNRFTTQLNSLQSSVSSLTTRVNSPVNFYQNCSQDTRSCVLVPGSGYWKLCTTPSLPANKPGYYTLSMACKYDPSSGSLESTALRQSGSNVDCLCVATSTTSSSGEHLFVNFPTFTCTLVITRCPISQNIV